MKENILKDEYFTPEKDSIFLKNHSLYKIRINYDV